MTTTVQISGMSCGGCAKRLKSALEAIPGITSLEVKVGKAVIEGNVDIEQVKKTISDKGYEVVGLS